MREHKCNSKPLFLNGAAATPASPSNKKFWEFRNAAETGGTAELLLYGDISRTSWWGDEVTPQAFAADLATIPAMDDLTVRICSGGGDVWAAQAIGSMLENRLGTVTAQIEGICASAATIVASHCKVVKAAEDATYMIHPIKVNPNGFVDMEGLKQLMDALTVMRTNVLNQYAKKTGHTVEEVAAWMDATSWWTAAEAKENGFIDEITESNQTAKIENRNGALFVNSIAVPGTFDDAPEFVRNRAVVAPATTEGFVNNTDPAGKPDKNDGGNDMEFKNADELRNGCPDLVKEIVDEAHAEAQKQERDRLAAIDEMDHKWIDSWMPDKEAVLHPTLCTTNWIVQGDRTVLDCGTLVVDDLSFSACPDVLTIGAVARPNGTSFHEKNREQVWKNTSIKRIAETIAGRYGLECKMDAEDVSVALKEQDDNDSSFLQKICSTYGLILKTYRNKIWIFDREKYKKKDSVATVKPIDIVPGSLSWNTTLAGTYTGGEFTYSNQKKKVNIKVTIGTADRMLKLNQYASSEADAKRQLQAAIDNKNHSATTISFTTMGNLTYCATQCIDVEGYGKIDGKYYMDSVGHTMNKSGGFVTKVSASRVGG